MPQPFRRRPPKLSPDGAIDAGDLLRVAPIGNQQANLFALAYRMIAECSNVDATLMFIYVGLMGGDQLAAKMYLDSKTRSGKNQMVNRAISESGLSDELKDKLKRAIQLHETLTGFRDRLAHGQYHVSPLHTDELILRDARVTYKKLQQAPDQTAKHPFVDNGVFRYTAKEIFNNSERCSCLAMALDHFIELRAINDREDTDAYASELASLEGYLSIAESESPPVKPFEAPQPAAAVAPQMPRGNPR